MRVLVPLAALASVLGACGEPARPVSDLSPNSIDGSNATPAPAVGDEASAKHPTHSPKSNSIVFSEPIDPATFILETPMTAIVGKPAPAFRAKDESGKDRSLAEWRGKRVVLWFFPKANTGG